MPVARLLPLILLLLAAAPARSADDPAAALEFDDAPLEEPLEHPEWFKHSFLDLREDLREALAEGKKGIAVYFGQKRCAYCRMLLKTNFGLSDIEQYTRWHFDLIPIDIWGVQEVTDMDGRVLTEREYAVREGTNFTPSLIFYDAEGRVAMRLRGYYPPYTFRAALEFVADGHYLRESFNAYVARGESRPAFEPDELVEEAFFIPPPHNLDRTRMRGQRPLAVFFEQGECHACDVLHTQPLGQPAINKLFFQFDAVQLDIRSDEPVITPDGRKTTARRWGEELGLFYAPSVLFFDEGGREIIRVDSVVRFFRLHNVLNYVLSKGYLDEPDYQRWRISSGF
jgi:thioredoxin-related protein